MKKLAILTLLATPAFAHQTPFDQPEYLKMSGGDPVAAQELSYFCSAAGKTGADCSDVLSGNGNLKQEAARKCVQQARSTSITFKFSNGFEIPGSKAHKLGGTHWHENYKEDSDGLHRHAYTAQDRQRGVAQYEKRLIEEEVAKNSGFTGSSSKTSGGGVGGGTEFGVSAPVQFTIKLDGNGQKSTTENNPLLSEAQKAYILKEKEKARNDPSLGDVEPSLLCFKSEKFCYTKDGSKVLNESYEPTKDSEKGKKGADNTPPKHEEDSRDIGDNSSIGQGDGGVWADNDTGKSPDDPMIATNADLDLSAKSPMELCLDKEFRKLDKEVGSKTVDPNAKEAEKAEIATAISLLKSGYCDESVYGRAVCQAHKNKQNSVVAVTILAERKEAFSSAVKALKTTGICDPQALGGQFCRDRQNQWNVTPAEKIDMAKPIRPGAPIRTFPGN